MLVSMKSKNMFYCSSHPHLSFCLYSIRRQSTLLMKESIVARWPDPLPEGLALSIWNLEKSLCSKTSFESRPLSI